jgi:hypothetical protein
MRSNGDANVDAIVGNNITSSAAEPHEQHKNVPLGLTSLPLFDKLMAYNLSLYSYFQ